jgi:hypothetical protein
LIFYYYYDVEAGNAIVEITGGNEVAPHPFFTWSGACQPAAPSTGNLIHADKFKYIHQSVRHQYNHYLVLLIFFRPLQALLAFRRMR